MLRELTTASFVPIRDPSPRKTRVPTLAGVTVGALAGKVRSAIMVRLFGNSPLDSEHRVMANSEEGNLSADAQQEGHSLTSAITICRRKIVPQMSLLLPMLLVITVIQVLPQLDLPDTAFQRNTAPIIAKSLAVSPPTFVVVMEGARLTRFRTGRVIVGEGTSMPAHPVNESRSILFCTLLC